MSGLMGANRFFRFRRPIEVTEWTTNGAWIERCEMLGIHAFGEGRDEAWDAFIELFEADWDLVAQEQDTRLTKDAQRLKQTYLELVDTVERVL